MIKLLNGDCLELMKKIPNGSVDMILCDLPYGTTQNKWDSIIDLDKLWKEYELLKIMVVLLCLLKLHLIKFWLSVICLCLDMNGL